MATITLEYSTKNSLASKTIDYILSLGAFKVKQPVTTSTFNRSMKDLETGKVIRLKNTKNPIEELLQ
jgi:hypothetical protein